MKSEKILIVILLALLVLPLGYADTDEYCAKAHVSGISPSSVEIDENFTVGIQIENCGENIANNAKFKILNPSDYIEIKEPLTMDVGELYYANSERHITYHMKTTHNAKPGKYVLNAQLTYGPEDFRFKENYNITFNVIGEEAELNIASVKTSPPVPVEGEKTDLTVRIENFGDGDANSVKVTSEHPFKGNKESFIGTLGSDEESPAIFTFIPEKSGEFKIPLEISYEDDFGEHSLSQKTTITIREKKTYWEFILGGIIIIALAIFLYSYKKKQNSRAKNEQKK